MWPGSSSPSPPSSRRPSATPQVPIIVVNLGMLSGEPEALQYTVALQVARLIAPRSAEANLPHNAGVSVPALPIDEERVDPVSSLMRRWGFLEPASVMRADGRVEIVALTSGSPDDLLTELQSYDVDIFAFDEDSGWD